MLLRSVRKSPPGTYSYSTCQSLSLVIIRKGYHCEVYAFLVLKSVEQLHEPFTLCSCQDIPLCQDVPYFVQFEKQFLAHHLQCADLPRILLRCKVNLPVSTLTDLRQDLEVAVPKSRTSFSQVRSLSSQILLLRCFVLFSAGLWWWRKLLFEYDLTILTVMNIVEKIEVVIKEV